MPTRNLDESLGFRDSVVMMITMMAIMNEVELKLPSNSDILSHNNFRDNLSILHFLKAK